LNKYIRERNAENEINKDNKVNMRKLLLKKLAFQSTHKSSKNNTYIHNKTLSINEEKNNDFN